MDLKGKICWITGAGSGIGEASATALASKGAHVILSGRRSSPLETLVKTIQSSGGSAEALPLDVTDKVAVEAAGKQIAQTHSKLDILVNSAGLNIPKRNWNNISPDGWDTVINADLNGAFYCVHAIMPLMRAQKDGLIINVSSWAGIHPSYLTGPAYSAAKHAMVTMNETINIEEGSNGIRACALCPGEVATPILETRPVPPTDEVKAKMLQAQDLAAAVLFVSQLPPRACVNTLVISPTHNRFYQGGWD